MKASLRAALDGSHRLRPPLGQEIAGIHRNGEAVRIGRQSGGSVLIFAKKGDVFEVVFS